MSDRSLSSLTTEELRDVIKAASETYTATLEAHPDLTDTEVAWLQLIAAGVAAKSPWHWKKPRSSRKWFWK